MIISKTIKREEEHGRQKRGEKGWAGKRGMEKGGRGKGKWTKEKREMEQKLDGRK